MDYDVIFTMTFKEKSLRLRLLKKYLKLIYVYPYVIMTCGLLIIVVFYILFQQYHLLPVPVLGVILGVGLATFVNGLSEVMRLYNSTSSLSITLSPSCEPLLNNLCTQPEISKRSIWYRQFGRIFLTLEIINKGKRIIEELTGVIYIKKRRRKSTV